MTVELPPFPSVCFPIPPEKIREELDKVRDYLQSLNAARGLAAKMYEAIQDQCPHTSKRGYSDVSGERCSACNVCGKEW